MKEVVFIDIDTQIDFVLPHGKLYVPGAEMLIPYFKALTAIALKNDIQIISSVDTHIKNDLEFRQFHPHCVVGSRGQKKIPQTLLKQHVFIGQNILDKKELFKRMGWAQQLIFEKNTYDIFVNHNLLRALKPFHAAFVYGVALDYCVKYAVLGLLQAGLKVNLIRDATSSVNLEDGRCLLNSFKHHGVKLMTTKEIIPELSKPNYTKPNHPA